MECLTVCSQGLVTGSLKLQTAMVEMTLLVIMVVIPDVKLN